MRLSMMPTAKKKLGGIGLFTRQVDGNAAGPGAGPRVVGLPATPAPQFPRELPQLQPPPEIMAARQDVTAALAIRSIPVPKGGRFASSQPPSATMSLPPAPQHFHPMQRTRTAASDTGRDTGRDPPRSGQNAWEDSTVASMFGGDSDGRAASERFRGHVGLQGTHLRHYSDAAYQRAHQSPATREPPQRLDDNMPFIIGENGLLKVIPGSASQARAGAAALGQTAKIDDIYLEDDHKPLDATPTKHTTLALRRTKLPHRDAREGRRDSLSGGGYSSDAQSLGMSPERPADAAANHIERVRLEERVQERARRDRERERELERERERERERELVHKRSTVFENLTPIPPEDPTFDNTNVAVAPTSSSNASPRSVNEALQRTPRGPRGPLPSLPPTATVGNINPPLGIGERSLPRTGSRRLKQPAPLQVKKRPLSPDYNDAELHAMSYADLQAQAFDYDPQQAAIRQQQSAVFVPIGGSLEERLQHYKDKGEAEQRQLFASLSVEEWEEASDWFLSRFSEVMVKIRKGRRAKRQMVERFEAEVSSREEAVRGKMEGIARTLEDLKHEGQTMMEGKDMDLEF